MLELIEYIGLIEYLDNTMIGTAMSQTGMGTIVCLVVAASMTSLSRFSR